MVDKSEFPPHKTIKYPKHRSPATPKITRTSARLIAEYLERHKDHSPAQALELDCMESLANIKAIEKIGKVESNRLKSSCFLVDKVLGVKLSASFELNDLKNTIETLYGLAIDPPQGIKKAKG